MEYACWFWVKIRVTNFGHIEFKEGAVYCYDVFTPFAVFLQEFCPHSARIQQLTLASKTSTKDIASPILYPYSYSAYLPTYIVNWHVRNVPCLWDAISKLQKSLKSRSISFSMYEWVADWSEKSETAYVFIMTTDVGWLMLCCCDLDTVWRIFKHTKAKCGQWRNGVFSYLILRQNGFSPWGHDARGRRKPILPRDRCETNILI